MQLIPNVGDRITETDSILSRIREGSFIQEVKYLGATFWEVQGKDEIMRFLPKVCTVEKAIAPVLVEKEVNQSLPEQGFNVGDRVDTESCGKNLEIIEINGEWLVCRNQEKQTFGVNQRFCRTSTISEALELSPLQPEILEKSTQLHIATSAKTRKKSIKPTSLKSRSIPTSGTITHPETSTCLQAASHVQEPQTQELKQDSYIQSLQCGLSTCDASEKDSPDSLSSKTPQDYSIAEWEQSYKGYPKAGTMRNGKLSPLPSLEVPKRGKEFLSLPTLTSNTATGSSRASGQSKLEKWLKDKGFLQDTQVLSAEMMATLFGFPKDWTLCLSDATGERLGELDLDIFSEGRSISTVQPLSLNESCISIAVSTVDIDEANLANSDHAIATKPSEFVAISHIDDVLVESSNVRALDAHYQFLLERREQLINSGASPQGVWLSHGKVPKRDFIQVVWKSNKPHEWLGGAKSRYIGKLDSDEHKSAIAQHKAGQELRKVEREIKKLQVQKS